MIRMNKFQLTAERVDLYATVIFFSFVSSSSLEETASFSTFLDCRGKKTSAQEQNITTTTISEQW